MKEADPGKPKRVRSRREQNKGVTLNVNKLKTGNPVKTGVYYSNTPEKKPDDNPVQATPVQATQMMQPPLLTPIMAPQNMTEQEKEMLTHMLANPTNIRGATIRFVSQPQPKRKISPFDTLSIEEKNYIESKPKHLKRSILSGIEEIRKSTSSEMPRRLRVACSKLPNKAEIFNKLLSCETSKYETWVDNALELPIGIYCNPPIDIKTNSLKDYLSKTRNVMDEALFGQHDAKDEVIRLVCQWVCSGTTNSFAIGLEGAPGIGKTTFAKRALAAAINRPFVFIALGGASDAAFLTGHSYTYEGAIAGRLADALRECKVSDPVIFIDELDKISKGTKGDEIVNVLIHLTDREQNSHFRDKYFHGIDIDLSRAIFVFSFNNARDINPILLDRLNIINMKTPSVDEKITICKKHLIPRAFSGASYKGNSFVEFSDECIKYIIENFTNESGVRDLDRHIIHIVNTLNVYINGGPECFPNLNLKLEYTNKTLYCSDKMVEQMIPTHRIYKGHTHMMYT